MLTYIDYAKKIVIVFIIIKKKTKFALFPELITYNFIANV